MVESKYLQKTRNKISSKRTIIQKHQFQKVQIPPQLSQFRNYNCRSIKISNIYILNNLTQTHEKKDSTNNTNRNKSFSNCLHTKRIAMPSRFRLRCSNMLPCIKRNQQRVRAKLRRHPMLIKL